MLYFDNNLNIEMINNSAEISGGAIYIINTVVDVIPKCALQMSSDQQLAVGNNFAIKSGNLMYAFPIYNCYSLHERKLIVTTSYYMERFNFSNSTLNRNDILDISSRVSSYNYCGNGAFYKSCFPGEKICLNFSALDYSNNTVYSIFEVLIEISEGRNSWNQSNLSISNSQKYQHLIESKKGTCTAIEISILYHGSFIKANGLVYVYISSLQANVIKKLTLSLNACPPGFELIKNHGACNCSSAVQKFFRVNHLEVNCDINTLSISWPFIHINNIWLGNYFNNESTFAIGGNCPLYFCSPVFDYSKAKFDHHSGTFFLVKPLDLSQASSFCRPHRKGVYCGECEEGYSVVFGSGDCMKCSNWWLLTIALYALAGPILIYVLYVLKLTLASGTMNAIIFYAQAANVNIFPFIIALPSNELPFIRFLEIFLSSINLNLGFPLCFYDGMNEFWKTVLSLVFPIYLLVIVVALIFLSRYSVWLSNRTSNCSVQVLVTVVHLSLSNLLSAIIDVLKKGKLYLDSRNGVKEQLVWLKNGDITYGSYNHSLLVAVTLIVVIGFCIPYLILLIGGRHIIKSRCGNKYFRAAYEAIHGPYKENRFYWFTARIILLISMFSLFDSDLNLYLVIMITLCLLVVFLFLQLHLRPFKNSLVGILDSAVIVNEIMLYVSGWYVVCSLEGDKDSLKIVYIIVLILVTSVFVKFVMIILYHILITQTNLNCTWNSFRLFCLKKWKRKNITFHSSVKAPLSLSDASSSFSESCSMFREPLVSDKNY